VTRRRAARRGPGARRAAALAAALILAAAVAACGIPTGAPKRVPASQVPAELLSPGGSATTTTIASGGVPFSIYLFNAQTSLQAYPRFLNVHAAGLTAILEYLVTGPSAIEITSGVTTFIPGDTRVLSVSAPVNNVITVDFSDGLRRVTGAAQVQAVEQIVYTIDSVSIPQTTGILFQIGGLPISVPKGNGTETDGPVSAGDYPNATTTTTTQTLAPPG
jgi:spore germination protein GerM